MGIEEKGRVLLTDTESMMAHMDMVSRGYALNHVDTLEGSLTQAGLDFAADLLLQHPPTERKVIIEAIKFAHANGYL